MKITVISTPIFRVGPPSGTAGYAGLEVIAWHCAVGLAKRGHQVTLVAPEGSEAPGCNVVLNCPADLTGRIDERQAYGGIKGSPYGGYWPALLGADVVIDHSWNKEAVNLRVEGRLKSPVLCVCHAPVNTMFDPKIPLPPKEAASFICISEDQGEHFRNLFGRDCRVAYNGVDGEFYRPLGVPRSNRFLFLARFSKIKGPDLAIEACLAADAELDMIGDTQITNEPELVVKCRELAERGRPGQIKLVGNQLRGPVVWWMSQAKALLHPVRDFREPFGLAPVEAQLCGCPVIAWDNGACRETIQHGITGKLVKSFDKLIGSVVGYKGAAEDEAIMKRSLCREQGLRFSIDRMCNRYHELATEVADNGGW